MEGIKEYIEREAALDVVKRTSGDYAAAWSEIAHMPAADVASVRHGKWGSNSIAIVCSECGRAFSLIEMFAHYCPWCGALMDGKEAEHD